MIADARADEPLRRLVQAADLLRGAPTIPAAVDLLAQHAAALPPGPVAQATVYLVSEHVGGGDPPAGAELLSLRAAIPATAPAGVPGPPPGLVLAEAAHSRVPISWAPAAPGASTASWLLLPLGSGPGLGVLALCFGAPLSPAGQEPYRLLAGLGAQAIEGLAFRLQAGRGVAEIGVLDRVSDVVNSSLSLDEILSRSLDYLASAIPFTGGSIALVNDANELEIRAVRGVLDEAARQVRMRVGQGISGWVAEHGQPYLSNDLDDERGVRPAMRSTGTNRNMGAYMAAPLLVTQRVIGILQVNSDVKYVFDGRHLALLAEVATRCAVAVERARTFSEMEVRANRLASLAEIARRISAALDLDELFAICYEQVRRVMPADAFLVALYEESSAQICYELMVDSGQVYPKRAEPLGQGLTSYVIRTRESLLVSERTQLPIAPIPFGEEARVSEALLMVPLLFEDRVLGAMSAQAYAAHAYSDADLQLLVTIANQTAVAIRNAQLYQSERAALQAKDEFLSLVSHELRTPLTTIKGAAQVMQRRMVRAFSSGLVTTPADQEARQHDLRQLAIMISQSDRLNALVNDLLDLSRLQSGRFDFAPAPADLAAVVRQTVEASRTLSSKHQILAETPQMLPGFFDKLRIEQVLTNLISNAVKYSPADTEVHVTLDTPEPRLALVRVRDAGPGLTLEEQAQLFQRFYRGTAARTNPRTGLGLGLYISRQIVEWHGGRIWVESNAAAGSTFHFT
ncbi:MAG TPA: GAF domain-containing sensor histidine kinase, partial [Chloroflexia bacterium]|nr:GAF domain-containing sensor histidine kinase [Chloroflexia bacterium]